MKPIVVLSGSFNPPTIAHHRTMLTAEELAHYMDTPIGKIYLAVGENGRQKATQET